MDPYASLLGIIADGIQGYQNADGDEGLLGEIEDVMAATFFALTRNLSEKTYLSGLIRTGQMLTDPERYSSGYAANLGATVIPAAMSQWTQSEGITGETMGHDPYMREVRGFMDRLMSRIPGLSDNLDPRRNFMGEKIMRAGWVNFGAGEYISPFGYGEIPDDDIALEVARLGRVPSPPNALRHGGTIDLREYKTDSGNTALDRWKELHGEVELGGRTLRKSLKRLIKSKAYQRMPEFAEDGVSSPRRDAITQMTSKYRERAYRQLLKELPVLSQNEQIARYNRTARRMGRAERQLIEVIR